MATVNDIYRHLQEQLAAYRAMEEFNRQATRAADLAAARPLLPEEVPLAFKAQAALREALEKKRLFADAVRGGPPTHALPAWSAAESVTRLMEIMRPAREMAERRAEVSRRWLEVFGPVERWRSAAIPLPAVQSHLAKVACLADVSCLLASRLTQKRPGG
jgi:hypothetical protein